MIKANLTIQPKSPDTPRDFHHPLLVRHHVPSGRTSTKVLGFLWDWAKDLRWDRSADPSAEISLTKIKSILTRAEARYIKIPLAEEGSTPLELLVFKDFSALLLSVETDYSRRVVWANLRLVKTLRPQQPLPGKLEKQSFRLRARIPHIRNEPGVALDVQAASEMGRPLQVFPDRQSSEEEILPVMLRKQLIHEAQWWVHNNPAPSFSHPPTFGSYDLFGEEDLQSLERATQRGIYAAYAEFPEIESFPLQSAEITVHCSTPDLDGNVDEPYVKIGNFWRHQVSAATLERSIRLALRIDPEVNLGRLVSQKNQSGRLTPKKIFQKIGFCTPTAHEKLAAAAEIQMHQRQRPKRESNP